MVLVWQQRDGHSCLNVERSCHRAGSQAEAQIGTQVELSKREIYINESRRCRTTYGCGRTDP